MFECARLRTQALVVVGGLGTARHYHVAVGARKARERAQRVTKLTQLMRKVDSTGGARTRAQEPPVAVKPARLRPAQCAL